MKGDEGHWGGGISIITQNFPKSPSILFHPLESSIFQTSPYGGRRGGGGGEVRCRRWEVKGRGRRQEVRGSVGRRGVGSGGDGDSAGWVGWRG
jgi:hypothetical protein